MPDMQKRHTHRLNLEHKGILRIIIVSAQGFDIGRCLGERMTRDNISTGDVDSPEVGISTYIICVQIWLYVETIEKIRTWVQPLLVGPLLVADGLWALVHVQVRTHTMACTQARGDLSLVIIIWRREHTLKFSGCHRFCQRFIKRQSYYVYIWTNAGFPLVPVPCL